MDKFYLGIDNGGSVLKAAIYDIKGQEMGVYSQHANIISPSPGFVERDLNELIKDLQTCIKGVLADTGILSDQIAAISVSCHGKGLYLSKKDSKPAYNGIISSDSRASELTQELKKDGTAKKIYPISYQQIWTGHPTSLLLWFLKYKPEVLDDTEYIFMGHDYIRYYLTGEPSAEITNMSGSALVDVERTQYSNELLHILGLESISDKLVPLLGSSEQCGSIRKEVAEATGLKEGTPVYAGFFDVVAAAISSGLTTQDELNATMGTWCIGTAITDTIIASDYPYIWGNYCIEDVYFVHEGSPTSASNLDWFIKELIDDHTDNTIDMVNRFVSESKNNKDLFFFPFLYASNISDSMPASFLGLRAHHTKKDLLKSMFEGVVYSHKTHLDRLLSIMKNVTHISLVGGPSQSPVWMQIFADIINHEVIIPNCKEAGCKGVALAAMVGSGDYKNFSEAAKNTISISKQYTPNQHNCEYYKEQYEKYETIAHLLSQYYT